MATLLEMAAEIVAAHASTNSLPRKNWLPNWADVHKGFPLWKKERPRHLKQPARKPCDPGRVPQKRLSAKTR